MRNLRNWFVAVVMVFAAFAASEAASRRYTGVEVQNLRDTLNAQSAVMVQMEAKMSILTHKLDADGGVTDTTYSSLVAPITTVANTVTGN
jgi:hypothetical protein